MKQDWEEEP